MRWIVIPDLQCPDHDVRSVEAVLDYINHNEFDGMLIVGDEADSPEPSRWNRGFAAEYSGTLQKGLDITRAVLADFVDVMRGKPVHLMRSNHQARIEHYIAKYAPALSSLRALEYETLLGFEELGIQFHRKPFAFEKGWLLAHGDEGSLLQTPGGTALGLAKRWGSSVVCGHTHRAGLQHFHHVVNGKITKHLFGLEVGHLMDMKKASYLDAGYGNWQQAIAVIDDGVPHLLPIINHKVSGAVWW